MVYGILSGFMSVGYQLIFILSFQPLFIPNFEKFLPAFHLYCLQINFEYGRDGNNLSVVVYLCPACSHGPSCPASDNCRCDCPVIVPNPHQGAVATQPRCVTQLHRRTRYITSKRDQGGIGAIVMLLKYCRFKHNYIIVNNIICGVKKSENKVLCLIISFCSSFHMGKFHSTSSSPLRI